MFFFRLLFFFLNYFILSLCQPFKQQSFCRTKSKKKLKSEKKSSHTQNCGQTLSRRRKKRKKKWKKFLYAKCPVSHREEINAVLISFFSVLLIYLYIFALAMGARVRRQQKERLKPSHTHESYEQQIADIDLLQVACALEKINFSPCI